MKSRLILTTDRKSASEGEYMEIRWACDACPDSLYLSIDFGCTQYSIAVSDSGTTRIPVPKSNGKMTVKLIGVISGKKVTESIDVRVKSTKKAGTKAPLSSRMKGNIYKVLHIAKHSETLEDMVVYQAMYGEHGIWVRPADMFEEVIEREGKIFRRFEPISEDEAKSIIDNA